MASPLNILPEISCLNSPMAMVTAGVKPAIITFSMPEKDLRHGDPDIVESVGTGSGSERAL
jgi:hypothetical protein